MATRYSGKDMRVTFGSTDVTGHYRVLEVTEGRRTIDATAGTDDHEHHFGGVKYGSATLTVLLDAGTAGTAYYAALAPGESGTLIYYPEGTVPGTPAGNVKHTVTDAEVASRTPRYPFDGAVELRVEFILNAAESVAAVE